MPSHLCHALQAALKQGSAAELEAVHVLALKGRDKDAHVREAAYQILAALPAQSLHAAMLPSDWRTVIDGGLGVWAEHTKTGSVLSMKLLARRACAI